jgi:hypothetical protein
MAMHAAVAGKQMPALIQLRRARERTAMALAARRLDVFRRQNGLLPRQRAVVRFGYGGRGALPTMAHRASELVEPVRNHRMLAEGLRAHIGEAGFFQTNVATRATVDYAEVGQPDLLNTSLEMALERDRIAAVANHLQIAMLVMTPLAEVVFRGGDRERSQKYKTNHAERANAVPKQLVPERLEFFLHERI